MSKTHAFRNGLLALAGMAVVLPLLISGVPAAGADSLTPPVLVVRLDLRGQSAVVRDALTGGGEVTLRCHQRSGPWSLMAVIQDGAELLGVFEDLGELSGRILFAGVRGITASLPKSLARTSVPAGSLYRGRTMDEIVQSPSDILGAGILAEPGDPSLASVSACLPPLRIPTFIGTRWNQEKVVFEYGGASINYVDAGKLFPEIMDARKRQDVHEGLIGGWLHVPRFLFPRGGSGYWEEVVFADEDPAKTWTQPVWYRVLRVEAGEVAESHYYYHHLPYPPRGEPAAGEFYAALLRVDREWRRMLVPPLAIDVPEGFISDFCRHALVLEMISRVGDHPRYGYPPIHQQTMSRGILGSGFSNVDSFQDTFTSSVLTFLEWGLADIARRYIDQYFGEFVRDDGSIDTRGPEIGQYGRMLTALARYYDYTRDGSLLLKYRAKVLAIAELLAGLARESRNGPESDPAFGIIRGWSEHDSGLQTDPYRFILPHYSNSAEVGRGFQDLGRVLAEYGRKSDDDALAARGAELSGIAAIVRKDLAASIERSVDRSRKPPYVPAVAGDKPTLWKNRAYAEMLHSGVLSGDIVRTIAESQSANGERLLGLLRNGRALNGFVVYGYAYGLLQHDLIREFLLFYYAHMSHLYSRGTWTAVEGASVDGTPLSTFCGPAQLTIPALTKWMLVFEDPDDSVLWLAKATPRDWLADGKRIAVAGAPTRFGVVGFELRSEIGKGRVSGTLSLSFDRSRARTLVRVRVPEGKTMRSVKVNGRPWLDFSPEREVISLPSDLHGRVDLEIIYRSDR